MKKKLVDILIVFGVALFGAMAMVGSRPEVGFLVWLGLTSFMALLLADYFMKDKSRFINRCGPWICAAVAGTAALFGAGSTTQPPEAVVAMTALATLVGGFSRWWLRFI